MESKKEPAKKQKQPAKKQITIKLIPSIVIIVILIAAGLILIFTQVVNKPKSNADVCSSQTCFDNRFLKCQPTSWRAKDQDTGVFFDYQINGPRDKLCEVTFTNSIILSSGKQENVSIACDYNNKIDFLDAEEDANANPTAYDCHRVTTKDTN